MSCVPIPANVAMILLLFPPDNVCEVQGLKGSQEMPREPESTREALECL